MCVRVACSLYGVGFEMKVGGGGRMSSGGVGGGASRSFDGSASLRF